MILTLALLIPALLLLCWCWLRRDFNAPADQPLTVCQAECYRWLCFFSALAFAAVAVGMPLTPGETEYSPYCAGLVLVAALCAPLGFLSRICYGEHGLTIRTYLGRVHRLTWQDVAALPAWSPNGALILRAAGKSFFLSNNARGCAAFLRYAAVHCSSSPKEAKA